MVIGVRSVRSICIWSENISHLVLSKGQCKIYVYTGPEQKGTGHILFLSCTEAGHKEFLCVSGGAQRGTQQTLIQGIVKQPPK